MPRIRPGTPEQQAAVDAYVAKIVEAWPPLTREQRDRIGYLLHADCKENPCRFCRPTHES